MINVDASQDINTGHISLKEAAKISGYSSDYIGQLIRQGKLSGKQVYCNVAWVTTEEAVREYLQAINEKNGNSTINKSYIGGLREQLLKIIPKVLPAMLYTIISVLVLMITFFFYVFSAKIEHRIEQRALSNSELKSAVHIYV